MLIHCVVNFISCVLVTSMEELMQVMYSFCAARYLFTHGPVPVPVPGVGDHCYKALGV